MYYILMYLLANDVPPLDSKSLFSRRDFVQMVQRVQENGAVDPWSFRISIRVRAMQESCEATRVGWLDVPWQPMLRGEWKFYIEGVLQRIFMDRDDLDFLSSRGVDIKFTYNVYGLGPVGNVLYWRLSFDHL